MEQEQKMGNLIPRVLIAKEQGALLLNKELCSALCVANKFAQPAEGKER